MSIRRHTERSFATARETVRTVPVTLHWLWSPLGLLATVAAPTLLGSFLIPGLDYPRLFGQPEFLTASGRLLAVGCLGLLALSGWTYSRHGQSATTHFEIDVYVARWLTFAIRLLGTLTFGAYAVWFALAIHRGLNFDSVAALLSGQRGEMYVMREKYFPTVGGVTTWMQCGQLLAPLVVLRAKAGLRRARAVLVPLVFLALTRSVLNSERLALFEILVALLLSYLITAKEISPLLKRPAVAGALVVGAWLVLFISFAAYEFFRSWTYVRGTSAAGFWEHGATLLLGYYTTALNLAEFDHTMIHGASNPASLFDGAFYTAIFGPSRAAGYQNAYSLETYTNRSGLLLMPYALGIVGGLLAVLAVGILFRVFARRMSCGGITAFALYCASAVGLLEIVRIFYFGSSRFVPTLVASAVLGATYALARSRGRRSMTDSPSVQVDLTRQVDNTSFSTPPYVRLPEGQ